MDAPAAGSTSKARWRDAVRAHSADLWVCAALVASVWLLYARTTGHAFVSFDDDQYVYANDAVRGGLGWDGVKWAFGGYHFSNWQPLTWLSYQLDVSLFGVNAGAMHAVNTTLHAASAVLLFLALRLMTGAFWPCALAAALFALHPLQVEPVAWVSGRKDVLSGLFAMLTLLAYAAYARRPGALRYAAVSAALALGLLAKPMLVTLPLVLLLLDYWPLARRSPPAQLVIEKLPLAGLAAVSAVTTVLAQRGEGSIAPATAISLPGRVANALVSYCAYLGKLLWPAELAFHYPHRAMFGASPVVLATSAVAAASVLALLTWLAASQWGRRPYLVVGWLWYVGMLLPVIGLIQVGEQAMADRYAYLPLIGIYVAGAWGLDDLVGGDRARWRQAARWAALLLAAYSVFTWNQIATWRDSEALYRHALAVTRHSHLALNNLGAVYHRRGEFDRAAEHFEFALRQLPEYANAHNNLGNVWLERGDPDRALAHYEQALRLAPDETGIYINAADALAKKGDLDAAAARLEQALARDPSNLLARNRLGAVQQQRGRSDLAIAQFAAALEVDPTFVDAYNNLGAVYEKQGDYARAAEHLQRALALAPQRYDIHNNLGIVHEARGELADAVAQHAEAARLNPESAKLRADLGRVLLRAGALAEAAAQLDRALALAPSDPKVHFNRAAVYEQQGRRAEAAAHYARALELEPGFEPARAALARTAEPAP